MKVSDSRIQENHHNPQSFYYAQVKKLHCKQSLSVPHDKKPSSLKTCQPNFIRIGSREEQIT